MARRSTRLSAALALLVGGLFAAQPGQGSPVSFVPIQAARVVEPDYPSGSIATGTVILKVEVGTSGAVRHIEVIHGVVSLIGAAEQAVRKWQFQAARLGGRRVRSWTTVTLAFSTTFASVPSWVGRPKREKGPSFEPIQIIRLVGAIFPITSVAVQGYPPFVSVALRVIVAGSGRIADIEVIHGVPSLTEEAERTVRKWKFQPATLAGKPLASPMMAIFTFRLLLGPMNSPSK